jgi:mannose-6-phosphate isomerase-like protein (cupin superfamily)
MNELVTTLASIERLQAAAAKLPQAELKTEHAFADGMYCRMLYRPADTLIIGKVHRREHFYMVMSGEVTIVGDGYKERVKAPRVFVSKPGTKRAVYAHEDSLCLTVHRTDETDLDKIEAELIEEDKTAMFDSHNKLIGAPQ